jgi:hypothetical protein
MTVKIALGSGRCSDTIRTEGFTGKLPAPSSIFQRSIITIGNVQEDQMMEDPAVMMGNVQDDQMMEGPDVQMMADLAAQMMDEDHPTVDPILIIPTSPENVLSTLPITVGPVDPIHLIYPGLHDLHAPLTAIPTTST